MHLHNFRYLIVFSCLGLVLAVVPGSATTITQYNDFASWQAATLSGFQLIDFQSSTTGTFSSVSFPGVQFSGIGGPSNTIMIMDTTFLGWNSGKAAFINTNQSQTMNIILAPAVTAFAFNVFSASPHGQTFTISVNGTPYVVPTNDLPNSPTFFGITSDSPITALSVALATASPSAYILVDNVSFGTAQISQTPEAATLLLIGSGLVGMMALRKRIMKSKSVLSTC
jgi:hypothetical protein